MWESASLSLRAQWTALWLLSLSLLAYGVHRAPKLVLDWAGLPHQLPTVLSAVRQMADAWLHIFVRGPQQAIDGLGYLPLLNVFATVMFLAGVYFYIVHWRSNRSRLLLSICILATVLIGIGGPMRLSILLPLIYAIVAGGLGYLVHDWFKMFPRNPIARALGYTLIAAVLAFSTLYNLRQYFVAWPRADATKAVFVHKL